MSEELWGSTKWKAVDISMKDRTREMQLDIKNHHSTSGWGICIGTSLHNAEGRCLERYSHWSRKALDFIQVLVVSSTTLLTTQLPSWTVVFGHSSLLHQVLLFTPLKRLKYDTTFCYEEVLSPWQKVLKYSRMITRDSLRTCNVFWIYVRTNTWIIIFTILRGDAWMGNLMELLDKRQTSQGITVKTWFHTGLQKSIK